MSSQIKIVKLIRSGNRVKIVLSNLEQPLVVSEETIHRYRLVDGVVITESQLNVLQQESDLYQCDSEAARLLALRQHSVGELRSKLKRKQFVTTAIDEVIKKYRQRGVLDDAQFAYNLARSMVESRPCGISYLTAYLQKKMIDRPLAEQTAQMVLSNSDDTDRAFAALERKWALLSQFELETARNKAYNYLARRGFSYDAARKAFDKLINSLEKDS